MEVRGQFHDPVNLPPENRSWYYSRLCMFLCRHRFRNEGKTCEIWCSYGVDFDEVPTAGYNKVSCYRAQHFHVRLFINHIQNVLIAAINLRSTKD